MSLLTSSNSLQQGTAGPRGDSLSLCLERLKKISQRGRHLSGDLKVKNEEDFIICRRLGAGGEDKLGRGNFQSENMRGVGGQS